MRLPQWLLAESEAWQRDGLITSDQRRAILARYDPSLTASEQASSALTWLAVLAAGIGAVVLVAWNWTLVPAAAKIMFTSGPMLGLYAAAVACARRDRPVLTERLALLAALFAGAVLFVTEDLSHVDPQRTDTLLLWAVVLAATAVLTPSAITAAVGTVVATWWILVAAGMALAPWRFLAVWLLLVLAVERASNRWVASGLALAFGVWVFFAVSAVWTNQPVIPAIAVVLAGSWIGILALGPAADRPAFARATPALGLTLLGMMLLMPSASHRTMSDWRVTADTLAPGLVLIGSLVCGTGLAAWRTGAWRSRPLALTLLSVLWLIVWFTWPGQLRPSLSLQWAWTTTFSAAVMLMGAAAVREAARTRDLGQFVLGLLSVVAFVIVRVIDARSLMVSGLMLLVSALVLWWLARMWRRSAAVGAAS